MVEEDWVKEWGKYTQKGVKLKQEFVQGSIQANSARQQLYVTAKYEGLRLSVVDMDSKREYNEVKWNFGEMLLFHVMV